MDMMNPRFRRAILDIEGAVQGAAQDAAGDAAQQEIDNLLGTS